MASCNTIDKKSFVEEKIICFKKSFISFLCEITSGSEKQFQGASQTKERVVVMLEVLDEVEEIIKKEKEETKKALVSLAGFDIDGKQKFVATQNKETYLCTDESILSSF